MTFAEFKKKWSRYTGKESSAYQEHFNDLCRLLGHARSCCTIVTLSRSRQARKAFNSFVA
jgi:hypothetical protein